ncbi:hypothetical protein PACTADRAFT_71897 [Pachysolen tannophilus NRRL Y-2460]|uniref:Major facilitator superfamily (MFS) profile domain-containing protein n=1 Tax=Pachysolen tannophilus NRRL Y-2460 TaxID=669874 RepID=A0A1E4TQ42_PACTA|nr:hypothetical protein PACTADRAFT_71897 [Pachysolen tannophilus NRRL Y-2460]
MATNENEVPAGIAHPDHHTGHLTAGGNAAFHNYINDFADVEDPLERRRLALEKIDNAKFGWYHVRAIFVAGVGFMTDAYDLFAINLAVSMLAYVYWAGSMPSPTSTLLKLSTSIGTVIGQVSFGYLGDRLGRKKIYGIELIVMISATVMQCCLGHSPAIGFVPIFTFWRIIMGIGIGGDYPLSSIITSEFSTTRFRGAIMGAVFANQGWGQLMAGIVAICCVAGYKDDLIYAAKASECDAKCIKACDQMWRILVGFGCVPGCIALYFRLTIPESPRYTLDVEYNFDKGAADTGKFISGKNGNADAEDIKVLKDLTAIASINDDVVTPPKASARDFFVHFSKWRHMKLLIGTAGSWFMLDIAYYGLGLNSAVILEAIGYASSKNVYHSLYNASAGNLILICAGSIPGYWFSVATVDWIGRKPIQIAGFVLLTAILCIMGFGYHRIGEHGLLAMYILAQFFENFGPNTTTFIVPGEIYPTRYRSTAHGISAACGKIGAIVAQSAIGTLEDHDCSSTDTDCWLPHVMEIFALFMLLGIFTSLLIPETKRMTLEEINEKFHGEVDVSKANYQSKYGNVNDLDHYTVQASSDNSDKA